VVSFKFNVFGRRLSACRQLGDVFVLSQSGGLEFRPRVLCSLMFGLELQILSRTFCPLSPFELQTKYVLTDREPEGYYGLCDAANSK